MFLNVLLNMVKISNMDYLKVKWVHNEIEKKEPVWLLSEINEDRFEVRKIEEYADGTIDFADEHACSGTTKLGIEPLPSLTEINSQTNFEAKEITKEEFEEIWNKRNSST